MSAAELASYLHRKGCTLGTVFVERTEKVPATFEALTAGRGVRPAMTDTTAPPTPRLFLLQRHVDVAGVSGVGPVAEGVEWSDGTVSLRWKGETPSTTFWQAGIPAVEAVHGHGGATEVLYLTDPQPALHAPRRR